MLSSTESAPATICVPNQGICFLSPQIPMLTKLDEISDFLTRCESPLILGSSETQLDSYVTNSTVTAEHFKLYHIWYRRDILVYVTDSIGNHRRTYLELDHIETIWLELHIEKSTILLYHICQPLNSAKSILDEQVSSEQKELTITRDSPSRKYNHKLWTNF